MEKKIKFLGQEVALTYNVGVQIAYEDIADKAFTIQDLKLVKNRIILFYAAIITANHDTSITLEDLLTKASSEDMSAIDGAMNELMEAWYRIPKTEPLPESGEESREKN